MRPWGFSTGAISPGNIRRALEMLRPHRPTAVELSALRTGEVLEAIAVAEQLDLKTFQYVSVHVPSKWNGLTELEFLKLAEPILRRRLPLILHPDAIMEWEAWRGLGELVVIENMDGRKPAGRTVEELLPVFQLVPEARFCFDIGHARQIDPTMQLGAELLDAFKPRLVEIHLSNVNDQFQHEPLTMESMMDFEVLLKSVPTIPIILETPVSAAAIAEQLGMIHQQRE
jgi:hypothetical protein